MVVFYYDTKSFPDYGKLSGKNLITLRLVQELKRTTKKSPMDFVFGLFFFASIQFLHQPQGHEYFCKKLAVSG